MSNLRVGAKKSKMMEPTTRHNEGETAIHHPDAQQGESDQIWCPFESSHQQQAPSSRASPLVVHLTAPDTNPVKTL